MRHPVFNPQLSFPRRVCTGLILPLVATPEGMAERRQAPVPCSRAALFRRGAHLAIGALASRRSAVTVLGRASPALRFRHCRRHPREGLAAGALIEPRRRHPTSRTAVLPGRHARSVCRIVSGDAPHRAGCVTLTPSPICSQQLSSICRKYSDCLLDVHAGGQREMQLADSPQAMRLARSITIFLVACRCPLISLKLSGHSALQLAFAYGCGWDRT